MTVTAQPGVYVGWLRHRRTSPIGHAFTYPLFMVLLDIDRIPALMSVSPFTSWNRWNWASFHEADHVGTPSVPLRQRLAQDAARSGHVLPDGPIFLLTHLRYLGYCFNPVSFYYCYDRDGGLRLVLAEVHNTFGGSHNYWLAPEPSSTERARHAIEQAEKDAAQSRERVVAAHATASTTRVFRARTNKSFYVSPFMAPDMRYRFVLGEPGARLVVHMSVEQGRTTSPAHAFDATLRLDFRPWTGREIVRALLRFPAMTVTVIVGIHWQALRLWWKGLPIVPRPSADGVYPENAAPERGRV